MQIKVLKYYQHMKESHNTIIDKTEKIPQPILSYCNIQPIKRYIYLYKNLTQTNSIQRSSSLKLDQHLSPNIGTPGTSQSKIPRQLIMASDSRHLVWVSEHYKSQCSFQTNSSQFVNSSLKKNNLQTN